MLILFVFLWIALAGLIPSAAAATEDYGQCGGAGYVGDMACGSGAVCTVMNKYYSLCKPAPVIRDSDPVSGFAALGGTTGGAGGPTVRVSTLAALKSAVAGNSPKTVILTSSLSGNECIEIGSNTSVMGANGGITLNGVGLRILEVSNVIVRNLKISKVLASAGDAIGIQQSSRVWVDHVDLSSDLDHDKDYYDGLLDITHGSTFVTVSWSYLHDHWKVSLIGHSDDNGAQDKALTVTYHNNYFVNANSRNPSFRFGTGHIYNNYYNNVGDGINTREGAQLLVENNVFVSTKKALFSTDNGYAVARGNDFGGAVNDAPAGKLTAVPYTYTLSSLDSVRSGVPSGAGANLSF